MHSAFLFRLGYFALVWLACVLAAPRVTEGLFGALLLMLAWGLPVAAPLIAWLDWRWLRAHPGAVNRWGFHRRA